MSFHIRMLQVTITDKINSDLSNDLANSATFAPVTSNEFGSSQGKF